MFVQMNNIDINKENWIKTIRKFYSAVNELIDILGKDMNEWGYDRETMEKKIQAYVNYFDDAKEWDELAKWKNNDEDKDLLFDKIVTKLSGKNVKFNKGPIPDIVIAEKGNNAGILGAAMQE